MIDLKQIKQSHLWYIVGYITTDGSLSKDERHVVIASKDKEILVAMKVVLNLKSKIYPNYNGRGDLSYKLHIGDVNFYRFLQTIGLQQRKSLTLRSVNVPDNYFMDFLRGVIDGDGNIHRWIHKTNEHVQWALRIYSGSFDFINWLKNSIELFFSVRGAVYAELGKHSDNPLYIIKFGKLAAQKILKGCYYPNALALERKSLKAAKCLQDEKKMVNYAGVLGPGGGMADTMGLKPIDL